ncbi:MAG: methylated-DNA--[protein]-cysteine S-methyltransferase [Candidatus Tectomicrobia bacterium]|nr:methylated-DNA--[protein]-cysteine S-methyltransferase [Candidatus Tectomicrobia bacterium]
MKQINLLPCGFREDDLIASAIGEADKTLHLAVESHIRYCHECHHLFDSYNTLNQLFNRLQEPGVFEEQLRQARGKLDRILAPKPAARLHYRLFSSSIGELCIARSDLGVPLVAWPTKGDRFLARLRSQRLLEVEEDGEDLQELFDELQAYLAGKRDHLNWSVDEMLVKSSFQRDVLRLISGIPYGAVMSYQGVAEALGRPKAVRAVAQALGWNPLAIVIPCHRVVGRSGELTGYAGGVETKRKLLEIEGIPLRTRSDGIFIDRDNMYVGWRKSREYCRPICPSLKDITQGDMLLLSSRTTPQRFGFAPCDICHPE